MKNKSNQPLASIIITNFNKSKFLLYSIKSCLKQDYKKKQIIFFDDKSNDGSLKKVKRFKEYNNLDFVILSNPKKIKTYPTFNHMDAIKKSLSKAKGEYIFLLDSDDYFYKNKISQIIKIFLKNKKIKLIMDQPILKYQKKTIKKNFFYKQSKNKWPKFPPTSCMCLEKKTFQKVLKKVCYKKYPNLAIDFRLASYYSLILKKFYIHKSHLTFYRQVEESMDSKYLKYRSKAWWKRRDEAFNFLNYILKRNKLSSNKSLDFFLTKLLNKILN